MWLDRLRNPQTAQRSLILAIQGLTTVQEAQAAQDLRTILERDTTAVSIQLEAARALGVLCPERLEDQAKRFLAAKAAPTMPARMIAAWLLHRHSSPEAIAILQRLAEDKEPAVVVIAADRLLALDPDRVIPMVERLLASPDAKVRSLAVELLFQRPTPRNLHLLANQLDDRDPEVRVKARRHLLDLAAKAEHKGLILTEATRVLAGRQWRGLEQATILLTQLDHKPAAQRLVQLLKFDRPDVFITASWGLRKLAVPETLPAVVSHLEVEMKRPRSANLAEHEKDPRRAIVDHQFSQLNQFLGQQKYKPGLTVLQRFVPRPPDDSYPEARTAAIWALGLIHEGTPDVDLTFNLEERLNDTDSVPWEDARVRGMSAITMARTQAKDAIPSLQKHCPSYEWSTDYVNNACGWGLQKMTGKALPAPKTIQKMWRDWFLTPLD
jgi:HEAT repeat protein